MTGVPGRDVARWIPYSGATNRCRGRVAANRACVAAGGRLASFLLS
jgi:hypothetical protein